MNRTYIYIYIMVSLLKLQLHISGCKVKVLERVKYPLEHFYFIIVGRRSNRSSVCTMKIFQLATQITSTNDQRCCVLFIATIAKFYVMVCHRNSYVCTN